MRASYLKTDQPFGTKADKSIGIQTFGEYNDYPQRIMEIVDASSTGSGCRDVYAKFIKGRGFADERLANLVVNRHGHTMNDILNFISYDYATHNGAILHVNINMNYKVREIFHIPFEHGRLKLPTENGTVEQLAIHPDWAKQFENIKKFDKKDIKWIDLWDFNEDAINNGVIEAGGWGSYKGQVYYFCGDRSFNYPKPLFVSVLTDMNTEEGLSNLANRNARNRFMAGGALVEIMNDPESEEQETEDDMVFEEWQGDENAQRVLKVKVQSKEEIPVFVPFQTNNYDKDYTVTAETAKNKIGQRFNQPPILRAEEVSKGLSTNELEDAYNYYNAVTEPERIMLSRLSKETMQYWSGETFEDFTILPLSYRVSVSLYDRLGKDGVVIMNEILSSALSDETKRMRLKTVLGIDDKEVDSLGLPPVTNQNIMA